MSQSIAGTVTALHAACRDVVFAATTGADGAKALVSLGKPGTYQPAIIVAVGTEVRTPITRPTMGAGRSREQAAEIDVVLSVYAPGDESAQATANAAAFDLQSALETYLRTGDNHTLGGACRDAWVSGARLTPLVAYDALTEGSEPAPSGRIAEATVTVTAHVRY